MRGVVTFVLAGGRGERLYPLTRDRAKPAVPFAGLYRIIDFTLTNCLHSGLRQVFVLTQYKSLSLERHIHQGWAVFSPAVGEFITTIPPQQRIADHWYLGTADAIWQNWYSVERFAAEHGPPEAILILAGDHVYKMDYRVMLDHHREARADLTVATLAVPRAAAAGQLGVLIVDGERRVLRFQEKPAEPTPSPDDPGVCLASMGIYVFRPEILARRLEEDAADSSSSHDFGRDIVNRMVGEDRVVAFPFELGNKNPIPYWRDVGTVDAYWDAHMDLVAVTPQFDLYDRRWPIHTHHEPWPPAKTVHEEPGRTGSAVSSLLSPGCIVSGSHVLRSILSPGVRVNSFATVEDSVLLAGVDVGRGARIRRAIVDKGVRIPPGEIIGYNPDQDRSRFTVTERGIVVIPKEARF
ncbi:MAG TPA: glucose-1-phosphate adenylyltransferase [Candidatus Acetothermia bacterium]|nr:glucose-1-phosphate adenylyltransferase [Candidatus Acetothermia bacterium]